MRLWLISGITALALAWGCGAAKDAAEEAGVAVPDGQMKFSGVVKKPDGTGIGGATVHLIKLLDAEAIKQLVEYKPVPDGAGGEKEVVRINFDKVHGYPPDAIATTDDTGAWSAEVPLQAYLVYTFGPGPKPGEPNSYTVHFWGIDPNTGELNLENLIGAKGLDPANPAVSNEEMILNGGPVPPPAPAPPAPPPAPAPTETEAAAAADAEAAAEETAPAPTTEEAATPPADPPVTDETRVEELRAPVEDTTSFWDGVMLTQKNGTVVAGKGTTPESYENTELTLPEGDKYFLAKATLTEPQTDPVYLVIQEGFDSKHLEGCEAVDSSAKTSVYPVKPNGKEVSYALVPPGKFFKFYFAKTASKEKDKAVVSEVNTKSVLVGARDCSNAAPDRHFQATLSWDKEVDLDIHVMKFKRAEMTSDPENSQVDQANWMKKNGKTLSLDVDNVHGYGPETTGDGTEEPNVNGFCYKVLVHYYSGTETSVNGTVDVTHTMQIKNDDGAFITKVGKFKLTHEFTQPGKEWWPVGVFPEDCETKPEVPPTPEPPAAPAAPTGACTADTIPTAFASDFEALGDHESMIAGRMTIGDSITHDFKCKFEAGKWIHRWKSTPETEKYHAHFSYGSGSTSTSATSSFTCRIAGKRVNMRGWLMRVPGTEPGAPFATVNLDGKDVTRTSYPYFQLRLTDNDSETKTRVKTATAYGSMKPAGYTLESASASLKHFVVKNRRPKRADGCMKASWTHTDTTKNITFDGYFQLDYDKNDELK